MKQYSDIEIIEALMKSDRNIIVWLRNKYLSIINEKIIAETGYYENSEDIFQLALLIIYKQKREKKLNIRTGFGDYFFSLCAFIWETELQKIKTNHYQRVDYTDFNNDKITINNISKYEIDMLILEHIYNMESPCREILMGDLHNALKESDVSLSILKHFKKEKQNFCKEKLIENIKADTRYFDIITKYEKNRNKQHQMESNYINQDK